jgi:energy-converting hydrogenase Eha subunit H
MHDARTPELARTYSKSLVLFSNQNLQKKSDVLILFFSPLQHAHCLMAIPLVSTADTILNEDLFYFWIFIDLLGIQSLSWL